VSGSGAAARQDAIVARRRFRGTAAHVLDRGGGGFQQRFDQVAVPDEGRFRAVWIPMLGLEHQADAIGHDARVVGGCQDAAEIEAAPRGVGMCGRQQALRCALPSAVDQKRRFRPSSNASR
jgi:hypothetical protein